MSAGQDEAMVVRTVAFTVFRRSDWCGVQLQRHGYDQARCEAGRMRSWWRALWLHDRAEAPCSSMLKTPSLQPAPAVPALWSIFVR